MATRTGKAKLKLSKDFNIDDLVKLYPLSGSEITDVVALLKSEDQDAEITQDEVGKAIVIHLGSHRLAGRLDDKRLATASLANAFSESTRCATAYENCGARHSCGQPYHCGPDFYCGTPFECGWRFENFSCVSSDIHCSHHKHNMDN